MTFSPTNEVEKTREDCGLNVIPIFPLRFALKGQSLLNLLNSSNTPSTPAGIDSSPDHELVRIRRGFVYVYDGDKLQAFRFETQSGDDNGSIYRTDTELPSDAPYIFTKYAIPIGEKHNATSQWTLLDEKYPYVFVPKDTPKAWIAYSETRWPYRFFFDVETEEEFRNKVMTEIDLSSRSGNFVAPITELEERVPVFRKDSVDYDVRDYTLENAIRMTSVEVESASRINACPHTGVLVALHDPIGEMQDLLGLMSVHSMTLANYLSEHQYPLVIGKAVKNYADAEEVSTTGALGFEWGGELSSSFETEYARLVSHSDRLEAAQQGLSVHWMNLAKQDGFGSLGALFAACETVANRFSMEIYPVDHTETLSFWYFHLSRMMTAVAASPAMTAAITPVLTGLPDVNTPPGWDTVKDYFNKAIEFTKHAFDTGKETHPLLRPSLSALMTVYGTEIVRAATVSGTNSTKRLTSLLFSQSVKYYEAEELQSVFQKMLRAEGYTGIDSPELNNPLGSSSSAAVLITDPNPDGKIGVVEFHAQIDTNRDPAYLDFARRAGNFDLAANGFGIVAAGLSLFTTISKLSEPVRAVSTVGSYAMAPPAQLIAAFSGAYEATYNLGSHLVGRASPGAGARVLSSVFGNNTALANAVATHATMATGPIASKSLFVASKIAGIVGVVMSGMMAYEGVKREDYTMAAGHGLMMAGAAVLLIPGLNLVVALVAAAAIAIGFVISLASRSDAQNWVYQGFWGKHSMYWGAERYQTITQQINVAKALTSPSSEDHVRIKNYFEVELATYIDINADLKLEDGEPGDGRFEIYCAVLQQASDLSKVRVSAWQDRSWPRDNFTPDITKVWISPGVVHVFLSEGRFRDYTVKIDVEVDRSHNGHTSGQFTADLEIAGHNLW